MAGVSFKEELGELVNSMFAEGLLDDQFAQLQMLQDASNPGFIVEVITLFCEDAERLLNELTKQLDQPTVDFRKVDASVHQLKGSSASVGASRVKHACIDFRQFCEDGNKEGCVHALNVIKHEYYGLGSKFQSMVKLEQRIQACESSH